MTANGAPRLETARATELGLPGFEVWETIGSTNDRARTLANEGRRRGWLVVALEQTAGRGRRGATWASAPGDGVWMSLVLADTDAMPQLPIAIGVACSEVLSEAVDVPVSVKWPNDLMIDDRKVGGILVERGTGWVVAGVGINVGSAPQEADLAGGLPGLPPTSLAEHADQPPAILALAGALARQILDHLDGADPVEHALDSFRSRDALRDRPVRTGEHGTGIARGLDEDGMLLLEVDDGSVISVRSGSVRVLPEPGLEE